MLPVLVIAGHMRRYRHPAFLMVRYHICRLSIFLVTVTVDHPHDAGLTPWQFRTEPWGFRANLACLYCSGHQGVDVMRIMFWILPGLILTGLTFWLVTRPWFPGNPVSGALLYGVVSGVSVFGGFWMIYTAIRYERNPWPFILLACVPYASFWYYHERIKPMRRSARDMTTQ
jgi:hypothetical protein